MRLAIVFGTAVVCLSLGAVGLSHQISAEMPCREPAGERGFDVAPPPTRELGPNDSLHQVRAELLRRQPLTEAALDPPRPCKDRYRPQGIESALHAGYLFDCPVTEVTSKSITVFYKGWSGWIVSSKPSDVRNEGGFRVVKIPLKADEGERRWESVPARRIRLPLIKALDGGDRFRTDSLCFSRTGSYPITMVEVGDRVELCIIVDDDRYTCAGICIWRRPGGLVPKAPLDDKADDGYHHYEAANALQDLEFKGVPLPRKYFFLKNNGTLPKHRQGIVAYPGVMPIIRPLANGTRRLFR